MEKFPKCSICKQQFCYQGPPPWLLPCLHAVCKVCLSAAETGTLKCSSCHKEFDREEHKFPEDKVRAREIFNLTVLHRPSELQCTNKQDGGQAVVWCKQCEAMLCENCQVAHSDIKMTRGHTVQTIDQVAQDGVSIEAKDAVCSTHQRPVDVYDATCGVLICLRCTRDDHAGHDVQEVDEAFQSKQLEMKTKHNQLLIHHESLTESILQMNSIEEKVDDKCSSLQTLKVHTMSELKSLVDQREKELDLDLSTCFEHIRDGAREKQQELETSQMSLNTSLTYIEKALTLTPLEYLELQDTMMQSVDACLSEHVSAVKQQEAAAGVAFSRQGLQGLKTNIASFGCFFTSPDQESQANEQQDNQVMSNYETLKVKFEELEKSKVELERAAAAKEEMLRHELKSKEENIKELTRQKDMVHRQFAEESNKVKRQQTSMEKFQKLAQQLGVRVSGDLSLVSEQYPTGVPLKLNCPPLEFDTGRANTDFVEVSERSMVNRPNPDDKPGKRKFNKYRGTCGTMTFPYQMASLPAPTSGPCRLTHASQYARPDPTDPYYYQVHVKIRQKGKITRKLIFEIGLCEPRKADNRSFRFSEEYTDRPVLIVGYCDFDELICTKQCFCLDNPFHNRAGVSMLTYGVVYDVVRGKVAFIDVNKEKILTTIHVGAKYSHLLPLFGVHDNEQFTVKMTLDEVKDEDINSRLRGVIQEALGR
ncbi:E3 ubiquitin-protein ligase TRIM33-like [Haliotis rufescens]|uniref:E3 ubiquitin-protein ligase TRIM33-like n=1 Tax=Haliotis rufescens TaxID=6454 RepID=UPI00201F4524|nr:E3 ubiquitin-protein ligase TRIM33-like [Haliotis rufescens]